MKKAMLILLLIVWSGLLYGESWRKKMTFRVVHAPLRYYRDSAGHWTGLDVELGRLLLAEAGYEPEFVILPWRRAVQQLKEGRLQFITNFSYRTERTDFAHYIGPSRYVSRKLVVLRDNKFLPIRSLEDLVMVCQQRRMKFGYQASVVYSEQFAQAMRENSAFQNCFESVSRPRFNYDKTVHGRILGFFGHPLSVQYMIQGDLKYKKLAIHSYFLSREPVFFGVSKKGVKKETVLKLFESYENLIRNGKLDQVRKKWRSLGGY